MIAKDLQNGVEQLGEMIATSSAIVPFTGAGISTECGIPDFRSPGGLWTRNRPIPFDEFVASQEARDESWRRRFDMEATFAAARPGRGHRALAALYKAGNKYEARYAWSAALVTAEEDVAARLKAKIEAGLTPATAAP